MDSYFEGDTVEIISDTDFDDLENATAIEFIVIKPSGEVAIWTAAQVDITDPKYAEAGLTVTDQDITYTTEPTDLDETGTYKFQAHVEWGVDSELHGTVKKFKVIAHLPEA